MSPDPEQSTLRRRTSPSVASTSALSLDTCTPSLPRPRATAVEAAVQTTLQDDDEEADWSNCPICLSRHAQDPVVTLCGHLSCWKCISDWLQVSQSCPVCKGLVSVDTLIPIYSSSSTSTAAATEKDPRKWRPPRPKGQRQQQPAEQPRTTFGAGGFQGGFQFHAGLFPGMGFSWSSGGPIINPMMANPPGVVVEPSEEQQRRERTSGLMILLLLAFYGASYSCAFMMGPH